MKTSLSILLAMAAAGSVQAADLASILAPLTKPAATQGSANEPAASAANSILISEKDLASALAQALKKHLSLTGDLRVALTQHWNSPSIPATASWEIKVLQVPSAGLESTSLVRFRIEADGQPAGEWQVLVRAQLVRPVLVAAGKLNRGQALDSTCSQKAELDVLREKQTPIPAETDLSNFEVAQGLNPEQVLTWKDVVPRQAIRKGQEIEVVASEGPINITMKGVALTGGCIGDTIVVRNPDSRKDIQARVLNNKSARVTF